MYTTTFILTILTTASTFLFLFPRFAKFNLYLYSIFYISAVLSRPYEILGIDNGNLSLYLTDKSLWGLGEVVKYTFIYYLTLPFKTYETKFFIIILISLLSTFIALRRLILFLRNSKSYRRNWNKYTFLILFLVPCITSTLYMIHLRQFFSFSIVLLINSFLINQSKNNLLIISFLIALIALIHPIYLIYLLTIIPFYLDYYPIIRQLNQFLNYIYSFFVKYRKLFFLPIIGTLILFGYRIYLFSLNQLPVFGAYALQMDNFSRSYLSYIPFILILLFQFITTRHYKSLLTNDLAPKVSNFSIRSINKYNYILTAVVLIIFSTEYLAPSIYSIGRIKSAFYPNFLLSIFMLVYLRSKSNLFLITSTIIMSFGLGLLYSLYQRLSFFQDGRIF